MAKKDRKTIDKVFVLLGLAATVVLVVVGCLSWYACSFAKHSVETELTAQKIFFPAPGSPAITALPTADQAEMNKYAGQQLVNGAQAKVYADNFIAAHLTEVAGGQTYSQVSAKALADPTNATLQAQANTLFKGETLRGLLLGDGYAYWTFGQIAQYAAITAFVGAAFMAVLVLLGLSPGKPKIKPAPGRWSWLPRLSLVQPFLPLKLMMMGPSTLALGIDILGVGLSPDRLTMHLFGTQ